MDLAKIVATVLSHGGRPADYFGFDQVPGPVLPLICVPTTAGTGSEVSHAAVLTDTQNGYNPGRAGDADAQARAKNTSLAGIEESEIGEARVGQFRLFVRSELDSAWDPSQDDRFTVWEATQHLVAALERSESEAAELLHRMGGYADRARQLAYVLFQKATDKGWADEASAYNGLITAWPSLQAMGGDGDAQGSLL